VIERDDLVLSCAIGPAYKDVQLVLKRTGTSLYELNTLNVEDIRYRRDTGGDVLEIVLSDRDSINLRVKPTIAITHFFRGSSSDR
jgi:hypothetical protein